MRLADLTWNRSFAVGNRHVFPHTNRTARTEAGHRHESTHPMVGGDHGCTSSLAPALLSGEQANAATTICNPVTWRYEVRQAGTAIGEFRTSTNICTTDGRITSSSAGVGFSPNALGSGAGWRWDNYGTSRVSTSSTNASWRNSGQFRLCAPTQISPLCSRESKYAVTFYGYPKNFVGPPIPPAFSCLNAECSSYLRFVYLGRY